MIGIILGFAGLFWWERKSRTAVRIKAMVGNPNLAETVGINTARLSAGAFVFGCCTAGLAGLVLAPTIRVEPMMGLDFLIRSFFSLVVGGLGGLEGLGAWSDRHCRSPVVAVCGLQPDLRLHCGPCHFHSLALVEARWPAQRFPLASCLRHCCRFP